MKVKGRKRAGVYLAKLLIVVSKKAVKQHWEKSFPPWIYEEKMPEKVRKWCENEEKK
ncbi:hypothetical protein [Mediterraneibacter agrestimuris]|uniref:hypothetical protein n=1 Tax=Mediterraneibacter agrestimuris TaxID=2941333 RepID=UPI00203DB44D|nr:hypothetical protein [Mediterraneibacter agrestimuris]